MPLYSADALILRTYKLGEADRIVVFLTRDRGKKRGVAKGARRPRSRFVEALGCAEYFAELIDEWAADADADERLYRLGASMVDALASGVPAEPLCRYFEYWLLSLQGVYPAM